MDQKDSKEMHFLEQEDEDQPQEVKDWEQKRLQENKDEEKKDIEEIQDMKTNDLIINDTFEENVPIVTTELETKEPKEYNTNNLVLNYYWILLVSKISVSLTLIIYLLVGSYVILGLINLFDIIKKKGDGEIAYEVVTLLVFKVGAKWLFFITIGNNVSVAFFSLTNFTKVLKDTKSTLKFYIFNIIKFIIFYIATILILNNFISGFAYDKLMKEVKKIKMNSFLFGMVNEIIDILRDIVVRKVGGFLGSFNNSLDQIVFKTIYIFLFSSPPKFVKENYRKYYRFLTLIPIIYIILCLILRALNNTKTIELSIYADLNLLFLDFILLLFYI